MSSQDPLRIYQQALLRHLGQDVSSLQELTPEDIYIRSLREAIPEEEDSTGLFRRIGRFIENVVPTTGVRDPVTGAVMPQATETDERQAQSIRTGVQAGFLAVGQGLIELPGLFVPGDDLPTDRAADFLERTRMGMLRQDEVNALVAGATPEQIADAHLGGEMIAYTLPVVASLKAARLATGISTATGDVARSQIFVRSFKLDSVAGMIFGSTFLPGDEIMDRLNHALFEGAAFGVGSLMINGLIFTTMGMTRRSMELLSRTPEASLERLRAMRRRESPAWEGDGISLAVLQNQEGFIATSPQAQALLSNMEIEQALVRSVSDTFEMGVSRGFVEGITVQPGQRIQQVVERLRNAQPELKFDAIRRGENVYDLHFGRRGLNNQQRAQLKRDGLYSGQLVEKGGSFYVYNRPGKTPETMIVTTVDGKTLNIKRAGVTVHPKGREDLPVTTVGRALWEDFSGFYTSKAREAARTTGPVAEEDIIRWIRQGQLGFDDATLRDFESAGAITHPFEVGLNASGRRYTVEPVAAPEEGAGAMLIRNLDGDEVAQIQYQIQGTSLIVPDGVPAELAEGEIRDALRDTIKILRATGANIREVNVAGGIRQADDILAGDASASGFAAQYMQAGEEIGTTVGPAPIRNFDDAFQSWLEARELPRDAGDIDVLREHFRARMRDEIWELAPPDVLERLAVIREELNTALDERELTVDIIAREKGFSIRREGEEVIARDVATGAEMRYANERFAMDSLQRVIRPDRDPMFSFLTGGEHGMPTGLGFSPSEGVFAANANVDPTDFVYGLPSQAFTNRMDFMTRLEEVTGIPFFNRGFAIMDEQFLAMERGLRPVHDRISKIWKGIRPERMTKIAEFWTNVEGSELRGATLTRAARAAGLSSKEIQSFLRARTMFDEAAEVIGLDRSRWVPIYYSRIRPEVMRLGRNLEPAEIARLLEDSPRALREFEFWAEFSRTGELASIELNPEVVMHKYFKSLFYKRYMSPVENDLRAMMETRIKDLPEGARREVVRRSRPGTTHESFVLPKEIRSYVQELIANMRGDIQPGMASARKWTVRAFKSLGMDVDPRLFDELNSIILSTMYGAAIPIRLVMMNRNAIQNMFTQYTRVGGEFAQESLARTLTQEGFEKAVNAGWIRPVEAANPLWDSTFRNWLEGEAIRGSGPVSNAVATVIRLGLRTGQVSRATAQKLLIPYGATDQVSRAWAGHWQRLHTAKHLNRYKNGQIEWDQFVEDGLPFFSPAKIDGFTERMRTMGEESALDWIGKQGADEANFIYGTGASPPWMQRPFGRLAGMFGQWSLWAKQLYFNRLVHATPKQRAAFITRTVAVSGAIANIGYQTNTDMWNWLAPLSLNYGGGPVVQSAVDARNLWIAPMEQKPAAARRLASSIGSLAFPAQLAFVDLNRALDEQDPRQAALRMTLGRPLNDSNFNYDWVINPATTDPGPMRFPAPGMDLRGLPLVTDRLESGVR